MQKKLLIFHAGAIILFLFVLLYPRPCGYDPPEFGSVTRCKCLGFISETPWRSSMLAMSMEYTCFGVKVSEIKEVNYILREAKEICKSDGIFCWIDRKIVKRGNFGFLAVQITNTHNYDEFIDINFSRPIPSGYTKNNQELQSDKLKWEPRPKSIFIAKNESKSVVMSVQVPKNAISGTYIFDIKLTPTNGSVYSKKFYIDVP